MPANLGVSLFGHCSVQVVIALEQCIGAIFFPYLQHGTKNLAKEFIKIRRNEPDYHSKEYLYFSLCCQKVLGDEWDEEECRKGYSIFIGHEDKDDSGIYKKYCLGYLGYENERLMKLEKQREQQLLAKQREQQLAKQVILPGSEEDERIMEKMQAERKARLEKQKKPATPQTN